MLKHFLNPPNWFTSASLFCGLYAIVLATGVEGEPNFYRAGMMILWAGVFDMLDGRVARLTKSASEFGLQLDSIVDVCSFGIAPAVLLYAWGIHSLGWVGLAGAFFFALCGAFRLARFNQRALEKEGPPNTAMGVTITVAGGTVAAAVMTHAGIGLGDVEHPVWVLTLTIILATLMVSNVPYPTPKTFKLSRAWHFALALGMGAFLVIGFQFRWSAAFLAILGSYVASGPIAAVLFRSRRREVAAAVQLDGRVASAALHDDFDDDVFEDSAPEGSRGLTSGLATWPHSCRRIPVDCLHPGLTWPVHDPMR